MFNQAHCHYWITQKVATENYIQQRSPKKITHHDKEEEKVYREKKSKVKAWLSSIQN